MTSKIRKTEPKYCVFNIHSKRWNTFESAIDMNHFITQKSLDDFTYAETYLIYEVEVKNIFKPSVGVNLDKI